MSTPKKPIDFNLTLYKIITMYYEYIPPYWEHQHHVVYVSNHHETTELGNFTFIDGELWEVAQIFGGGN